jgi:hypothetical protein
MQMCMHARVDVTRDTPHPHAHTSPSSTSAAGSNSSLASSASRRHIQHNAPGGMFAISAVANTTTLVAHGATAFNMHGTIACNSASCSSMPKQMHVASAISPKERRSWVKSRSRVSVSHGYALLSGARPCSHVGIDWREVMGSRTANIVTHVGLVFVLKKQIP